MALTHDLRRSVTDATPVYAVVGATDVAAEKLRAARTEAIAVRRTLTTVDPKAVQKDVTARAEKAIKTVQDVPATVLERTLELAGKAQEEYDALATRGEELVKRIRIQQATQDLVAQAEQTVAATRGAVTTMRKAVAGTQSSAKATLTTGRHQAVRVADVVADVVTREAKDVVERTEEATEVIADTASDARKRTTTAAKRTRTTARKGAKATTTRTKAAATSARKTAPRARKATTAAADKVGA